VAEDQLERLGIRDQRAKEETQEVTVKMALRENRAILDLLEGMESAETRRMRAPQERKDPKEPPANAAKRAFLGQPVWQVSLVCQEPKEYRDPPGIEDPREVMEVTVWMDRWVTQGCLGDRGQRERLVNRERLAREEYREKRVTEVIEASKAPWDLMVHRAPQAKSVSRDQWDNLESRVQMA